jgi:nucleotide-binding universal stress UspA family protein
MSTFAGAMLFGGEVAPRVLEQALADSGANRYEFQQWIHSRATLVLLVSAAPALETDDSDPMQLAVERVARDTGVRAYRITCFSDLTLSVVAVDEAGDWAWQDMGLEPEGNLLRPFTALAEELELTAEALGLRPTGSPPLVPVSEFWSRR